MATKKIIKKATHIVPSQVSSLKIRIVHLETENEELKQKLQDTIHKIEYEMGRRAEVDERLDKAEARVREDFTQFNRNQERWMEEVFFLRRFVMLLAVDADKTEGVAKLIEEMQQRGFGR